MSKEKCSFFKSDKNLFLRLKKNKDKQAFIDSYDKYIDDIYRFVFFKVGNKEEAEDITSSVFIKCWSQVCEGKLNDSHEYKSLKAFLYKIARNTVIDYYRQNKPEVDLETATEIPNQQDLVKQTDLNFDFALVQEKLLELKTEYRGIIVMHYINQLSIAEIAKIMDKTKGNVRVTLFRALNALREIIERK